MIKDVEMSKRLEITSTFIKTLVGSSPARRKFLLRHATKTELDGLFEICLNLLRGNLPLDTKTFKAFKRQRKIIEALGDKRVALRTKKQIINQKGGFVGKLAIFALPLLTDLISRAFSRRKR